MDTALHDNITRDKILLTLKKKGSLSINGLSKEVNVTAMGVRQHLLILERKGIVEYVPKKHGKGRPGFFYHLTETADDLFPKTYLGFAIDILRCIEEIDGREKIDEIFRRRAEAMRDDRMKLLSKKHELSDRLHALAEILQKDSCMVELEEDAKYFNLKIFNCPISKISSRFNEACKYDYWALKELIGNGAMRKQCLSEGDPACIYVIPRNGKSPSA